MLTAPLGPYTWGRLVLYRIGILCSPFQQIDFLVRDWQNFHDESNFTLSLKEMDEYRDSFFAKRNAADLRVGIWSIFDS